MSFNTIGEIIIIAAFGFFLFFVYVLAKSFKANRKARQNQRSMVSEICGLAKRGSKFRAISSSVGQFDKHASVWIHRTDSTEERYSFNAHGYENLTYNGMVQLFNTLKQELNGSLEISYKEVGGYSDTITSVSEGIGSGGSTAYYVNTAGGGSAKLPTGITLYSEEETRRRQQMKHEAELRKKQYKKTF